MFHGCFPARRRSLDSVYLLATSPITMKWMFAFFAVIAAAVASCTPSVSDVERGRHVADKWCSECHRVAVDQPSGSRPGHVLAPPVNAPSFMSIADRPGVDAASLRHFLADLHLPMPTYRLYPDEREAVIAYIMSLAKKE
jgi:mono/diheme cytochrome c family protein